MAQESTGVDIDGDEWATAGERLRLARLAANMSVRELARRVGVSPSHVSQVERGLAAFSVSTLYNVVSVFGLSMDSLFVSSPSVGLTDRNDVAQDTALDDRKVVLRKSARPTIQLREGPRWERLTARAEEAAEFLEVVYAARPSNTLTPDYIRHDGREYGVILSGQLHVQIGFEETVLEPGDSVSFDSSTPHRFWNASNTDDVHAIWFVRDRADSDSTRDFGGGIDSSHWS